MSLLQPVSFQPESWQPSGCTGALCCVGSLPRHLHAPLRSAASQGETFPGPGSLHDPCSQWGHHKMFPSMAASCPILLRYPNVEGLQPALPCGRFPSPSMQ